jgi:hypothetical protein
MNNKELKEEIIKIITNEDNIADESYLVCSYGKREAIANKIIHLLKKKGIIK